MIKMICSKNVEENISNVTLRLLTFVGNDIVPDRDVASSVSGATFYDFKNLLT